MKINLDNEGLTDEEIKAGWHFCPEWDYLLVGPETADTWECCTCSIKKKDTEK